MSNDEGRGIRKRLARSAGKTRVSDMDQDDIDKLWREHLGHAETPDDELWELFKLTSDILRRQISFAFNTVNWADVTLAMLKEYPRQSLNECENDVLDTLIKRKFQRNAKVPATGHGAVGYDRAHKRHR